VEARQAFAYYRTGDLPPGKIKPYPAGLKMVAGDPHATRGQPWLDLDEFLTAFWRCVSIGDDRNCWDLPNNCTVLDYPYVIAVVKVPTCAKYGVTDSADRRSHVAYPQNGACPATHPTATVKVSTQMRSWTGLLPAVSSGVAWVVHIGSIVITNAVDMNDQR
jgi:Domain of unknown function (DUF1996)